MEVVTRVINHYSRADVFKITPIGDIHFGGSDCAVDLLRACVRKIADDDKHYWIGMGDYCEHIGLGDKRLDTREIDPNTRISEMQDLSYSQARKLAAILDPIRSRCLGLLSGNHEEAIALRYFQDIHKRFCSLIETDYSLDCGYSAIIRTKFIRSHSHIVLNTYAHHGAGAGRKSGSAINRIKEMALHFPNCQLYLMGHVHRMESGVMTAIDVRKETDELIDIPRAWGITGTFKKTYEHGCRGYGEKAQYEPTPLGVISFIIKFSRKYEIPIIRDSKSTDGLPA